MKLTVITHPNSRKPRIEKDLMDTIHIYVNKPAVEGKANVATLEALSEYFKISKSKITLISGHKSKSKVFLVEV